jgi:hypothetical protein
MPADVVRMILQRKWRTEAAERIQRGVRRAMEMRYCVSGASCVVTRNRHLCEAQLVHSPRALDAPETGPETDELIGRMLDHIHVITYLMKYVAKGR